MDQVFPSKAQRSKARRILARLAGEYEFDLLGNKADPLDELFFILLSTQTTEPSYQRAYRAFRRAFYPWSRLLEVSDDEIAAVISSAGLSRQRASAIRSIVGLITEQFGGLSLSPLRGLQKQDALKFLLRLPRIGPKSASCILGYSLGHDSFPLDTHCFRVLDRLGLMEQLPKDAACTHRFAEGLFATGSRIKAHVYLVKHGRGVCRAKHPRCEECVLRRSCDWRRGLRSQVSSGKCQSNVGSAGTNHSCSRPQPRLKALSLFSGAMGLDLGLESTGCIEVLACVEKDPDFCKTIRKNRDAGRLTTKDVKVYERSVSDLDPLEVLNDLDLNPGELDLVVGGPPCQSFSTAGKRRTVQDHRGSLLWEFLKFVASTRPRAFLMENVRGLHSAALRHRPIKERPEHGGPPLSPDEEPGSVLRQFIADLRVADPAYRMDAFLVNAVNYGAPQLRERLLIIGNRDGAKALFPSPTHGNGGGENGADAESQPFRTLGHAIRNLADEEPVLLDFSPRKKRYLAMVPAGGNWRTLPESVQRESMGKAFVAKGGRSGWWRRLSYEFPCPTLVTMPNHASTSLCHPEEVRVLSLKEYAAIQEFPPDWEFCGTVQKQYAQAGNAVPVRLGRIVGESIVQLISGRKSTREEGEVHEPFTLEYIRSHVRTRKWFKAGTTYVSSGHNNGKVTYAPMKTQRATRVLGKSNGQS